MQSRLQVTVKPSPQQSQCCVRYGGSIPYHMNNMLRHSWSPSSIPLVVIGATVIYLPVFRPYLVCWNSNLVSFLTTASNSSSASCPYFWHILDLPFLSKCLWSPGRNSVWPCRALTRCLVTTHEDVYLQCTFFCWVWYGHAFLIDLKPRGLQHPQKKRREKFLSYHLYDQLEFVSRYLGGVLHEGPLLLEGSLQASICIR